MMYNDTDIDIDVKKRNDVLALFEYTVASMLDRKGHIKPHSSGVYFHRVPYNPISNQCTLEYKEAHKKGFFKIDILNLHLYDKIRDNDHLENLLVQDIRWELLEREDICRQLIHLKRHHEICQQLKPRSIAQLAALLAIIRPAKRHLVYSGWDEIMRQIWVKPSEETYFFKKSHAIAYAHAVIVNLNLLIELDKV